MSELLVVSRFLAQQREMVRTLVAVISWPPGSASKADPMLSPLENPRS